MDPFPDRSGSKPLRIQHIPAGHPYVRHVQPPPGLPASFSNLPDPTPPAAPGSWRPSPALDPAWIAGHAADLDVVHLHFGYEHLTAGELTGWAGAVHAAGLHLFVTVHDIDNPHLADQTRHHAAVAAVLAAADRVITLTPGAAAEIHRRWGRSATVIEHPHVLSLDLVGTRIGVRRLDRPRIGVPLGSLRANVAAGPVLSWLPGAASATVVVRVNRQLYDPNFPRLAGAAAEALRVELRTGEQRGRWTVQVVEPGLPDKEIWRWLGSLDALVLPYAWGTHSGWAEACADVGTSVIAPDLGHWHEQHPLLTVPPWDADGQPGNPLGRLRDPDDTAGGGLLPISAGRRHEQRRAGHDAHADLYRSVRHRSD